MISKVMSIQLTKKVIKMKMTVVKVRLVVMKILMLLAMKVVSVLQGVHAEGVMVVEGVKEVEF